MKIYEIENFEDLKARVKAVTAKYRDSKPDEAGAGGEEGVRRKGIIYVMSMLHHVPAVTTTWMNHGRKYAGMDYLP